jgi:uncharacterized protein (TIGR02466 family)
MKYNLFNSYVWKSKINYNKKDFLINDLTEDYNKNKNNLTPNWNCLVYSSFKKEQDKIPEDLLDIIEIKIKEFLDNAPDKLKIKGTYILSEIWYNIYDKHHFQEPHTHGDALFSGCYYLKFNKQNHHQTTFYNPNFNIDYSKLEDNSYFSFSPDCEEDDLIIFPSNLKHGTKGLKNCSNGLRITISFNITNPDICLNNSKAKIKNKGLSYQ